MEQKFDRSAEDLGNSVQLEHLNLTVPDQQTAILFYITGLGFTRDPYIMTGLENMWVNIGRSQIHLPVKKVQVLRGHTGLVVPSLNHLVKRLAAVKDRLAQTRFGFERQNGDLAAIANARGLLRGREGNVAPALLLEVAGLEQLESPPMPEYISRWRDAEAAR